MINGFPIDQSVESFTGASATVAMAVPGLEATDNLLAVLSYTATGLANGHAISDFTVASGTLTAATIDLSGKARCYAIWTATSSS